MLDLNLIGFEELNSTNIPCFKIFFHDRFLPLLLDNCERNFEEIFKSVEIQWQSLCTTTKAFYDTRYEASRQSDKKFDKIIKFEMNDIDVKQSCFNLFDATQKTVEASEKAACSEVLQSFKYFCHSKFRERASPQSLRQEWNNLSDIQNPSKINADANLQKVFGGKKQVSFTEVTKLANKHLSS